MTDNDDCLRVLVVADVWCQIDGLCDQVKAELDRANTEVFVVAPALVGPVRSFYGDIDAERAATTTRASSTSSNA